MGVINRFRIFVHPYGSGAVLFGLPPRQEDPVWSDCNAA